ncbi:MAG: sel1 repeat family protein [Alphaproteobacteria bacterium]|nr:sel1 repeat family protein [Alphaproteobacteria bacterium]
MKILIFAVVVTIVAADSAGAQDNELQEALNHIKNQNFHTALQQLTPLAQNGNPAAQYHLGRIHQLGWSVTPNITTAKMWFQLAAEQNHPLAQIALGTLHEGLFNHPRNYSAAANWYRKAAEQGNPEAQANLAALYNLGRGVPKNKTYAFMWFHLAAQKNNDPFFRAERDSVARRMSVAAIFRARRLAVRCREQNYKQC